MNSAAKVADVDTTAIFFCEDWKKCLTLDMAGKLSQLKDPRGATAEETYWQYFPYKPI
jgi:hypothetical protein